MTPGLSSETNVVSARGAEQRSRLLESDPVRRAERDVALVQRRVVWVRETWLVQELPPGERLGEFGVAGDAVLRDDDRDAPQAQSESRVEHSAVRGGADDHRGLDAFVLQDLLQVGAEELVGTAADGGVAGLWRDIRDERRTCRWRLAVDDGDLRVACLLYQRRDLRHRCHASRSWRADHPRGVQDQKGRALHPGLGGGRVGELWGW